MSDTERPTRLTNLVLSIALVLGTVLAAPAVAQTEITKSDFTALKRLRSTELSIFGIKLGDTAARARELAEAAGLIWSEREYRNPTAPGGKGKNAEIAKPGNDAYVIFGIDGDVVASITLHKNLQPLLAGESSRLLNVDCTDQESAARLKLLGREDRRTVDSSRLMTVISYEYDKEGIRLVRLSTAGVPADTVALTLRAPAKARE